MNITWLGRHFVCMVRAPKLRSALPAMLLSRKDKIELKNGLGASTICSYTGHPCEFCSCAIPWGLCMSRRLFMQYANGNDWLHRPATEIRSQGDKLVWMARILESVGCKLTKFAVVIPWWARLNITSSAHASCCCRDLSDNSIAEVPALAFSQLENVTHL